MHEAPYRMSDRVAPGSRQTIVPAPGAAEARASRPDAGGTWTRRSFMHSAVATGLLARLSFAGAGAVLAACASEDAAADAPFRTLTAAEGRTIRAFSARILPPVDGRPGADDLGAAWFIDRAIGEFMPPLADPVRGAAAALDAKAAPQAFADLDGAAQDAILKASEEEPWFGPVHMLVICGVFADAQYGGNRGNRGHELVDMKHASAWQPPFGFYDAENARAEGDA